MLFTNRFYLLSCLGLVEQRSTNLAELDRFQILCDLVKLQFKLTQPFSIQVRWLNWTEQTFDGSTLCIGKAFYDRPDHSGKEHRLNWPFRKSLTWSLRLPSSRPPRPVSSQICPCSTLKRSYINYPSYIILPYLMEYYLLLHHFTLYHEILHRHCNHKSGN